MLKVIKMLMEKKLMTEINDRNDQSWKQRKHRQNGILKEETVVTI